MRAAYFVVHVVEPCILEDCGVKRRNLHSPSKPALSQERRTTGQSIYFWGDE